MHLHTARDLDKVRGGSEQDREREGGGTPSAPARVAAHIRRVSILA